MYELIEFNAQSALNIDLIASVIWNELSHTRDADISDDLIAKTTARLSDVHPTYAYLASRMALKILYNVTPNTFSKAMDILRDDPNSYLNEAFIESYELFKETLDSAIVSARDFRYSYFQLKAFEDKFLLHKHGYLVERPQYLFMRVAVALHAPDLQGILRAYALMSEHLFMHSSETLCQAGTKSGHLNPTFLLGTDEKCSSDTTHKILYECAKIATTTAGIGISINRCPSTGSTMNGIESIGTIPILRLFEASMAMSSRANDPKRHAMTVYIEPWHADILIMLDMNTKLTYALWVPDEFMKRVEADAPWSLFSPNHVPLLGDSYGEAFGAQYISYELDSKIPRIKIQARSLWNTILHSQIRTGIPFIVYKDAVNTKNNQKNLGTVSNSSFRTAIMQHSSAKETATCNVASIVLPSFVVNRCFDFRRLHSVVKFATHSLNRAIDVNHYPTYSSRLSSYRHRAIGIGIQGLADVFIALRIPFDSLPARSLNIRIAETMYHAAVEASNTIAKYAGSYTTFRGSPASHGHLQFDLWKKVENKKSFNWQTLRTKIELHGLANSLLIAIGHTADITPITGCNESCEPIQSNLLTYCIPSDTVRTQLVSPQLLQELTKLGLWSNEMHSKIIRAQGSIQSIREIPQAIRSIFKTAWEIKSRVLLDMAIDRAPYVCHSQSMCIYTTKPTIGDLNTWHFYGWRHGMKTGMYALLKCNEALPLHHCTCPSPPNRLHH